MVKELRSSAEAQECVINLHGESELYILDGVLNKSSWSNNIRDDIMELVELSQRRSVQHRFRRSRAAAGRHFGSGRVYPFFLIHVIERSQGSFENDRAQTMESQVVSQKSEESKQKNNQEKVPFERNRGEKTKGQMLG